MHLRLTHLETRKLVLALAAGLLAVAGCGQQAKPVPAKPLYKDLGPKANVPAFMKGTIWERTELGNTEPYPVSSFGMVSNLRGTGDCTAPNAVREYIIKEMVRHGYGSRRIPGYENVQPEQILSDPRFAIVRVFAFVPPGARKGQRIDVYATALDNSYTSSLARGILFRSDLTINGADALDPTGKVNVFAQAEGPIFVNPVYAINTPTTQASNVRASLRTGSVLGGGVVNTDRPLWLLLRTPERRMSRAIEFRLDQRFQDSTVAAAQDEGYVHMTVPEKYHGDWEHFAAVATHTYMNADVGFATLKAQELVGEARKPNAPLNDISFCWEALGPPAVPMISPLLSDPSPAVAFAAARAAACIGDEAGENVLVEIAKSPTNEFRTRAIEVLGSLPGSPAVNVKLADLLDSRDALVRTSAYRVLAARHDPHIRTTVVNESFVLDVVPSSGPPMIYCSRTGDPRIALFGTGLAMQLPVTFLAFDSKLLISSPLDRPKNVTITYLDDTQDKSIQVVSHPDLAELIARLGGASKQGLRFGYGDVVAMLQSMSTSKVVDASFVLQELPELQEQLARAPTLPEQRPQGDIQPGPNELTIPGDRPTTAPSGRPQ